MPVTIFGSNNPIAKSTKTGNAVPAFPDVCKTPNPAGPTPIPYPNQGTLAQKNISPEQKLANSGIAPTKTVGNQAASGAISNTFTPTMGSAKVIVDGKKVVRNLDVLNHNAAAATQLRNQLQSLHTQIMALRGADPNRWHQLLDDYVITTAQLYIALTAQP